MPSGMKRIFATKLTDVATTDKDSIGTVRREGDKEYMFLLGVASVAAGSVVQFNESYATTLLPSGTSIIYGDRIGIAQAAVVASKYGWFQVRGPASAVLCGSTAATNAQVFTSKSTAGRLSTSDSGNDTVVGLSVTVAASSNTCSVMLMHPTGGV